MTQLVQDLKSLRELLSDPKSWTKSASARDRLDRTTYVHGDDAVSFCVFGGAERITGESTLNMPRFDALRKAIRRHLPSWCYNSIVYFNDNSKTTHEDVLGLIDETIEMEKQNV